MNLISRLRIFYQTSNNKLSENNNQNLKAHNTSSSDMSDRSNSTPTILSPDSVFKHTTKLNVSSQYYSKTEITLETSSLEQMYCDKNIFSSQIINKNFLNKSNSFLDSTMSSDSSIDQTIQVTAHSDNAIQTLHGQIRLRLNALRYIALNTLNIHSPVNICMLESIYNQKLNQLTSESSHMLSKFDKNNLRRPFFNTLSVTIKGLRHRSKSVERNCIKDYYSIERDLLQRKLENKIRFMQFEILSSIKDLELHYCMLQESMCQVGESVSRHPKYTSETSIKQRIRKRNKHRSCSHSRTELSFPVSVNDSRRISFGLDRSVVIPDRYKNECAAETMV